MINVEKYFKPDLRKARKRLTKETETILYELNPKYANRGFHIKSSPSAINSQVAYLTSLGYILSQSQ